MKKKHYLAQSGVGVVVLVEVGGDVTVVGLVGVRLVGELSTLPAVTVLVTTNLIHTGTNILNKERL